MPDVTGARSCWRRRYSQEVCSSQVACRPAAFHISPCSRWLRILLATLVAILGPALVAIWLATLVAILWATLVAIGLAALITILWTTLVDACSRLLSVCLSSIPWIASSRRCTCREDQMSAHDVHGHCSSAAWM